MGDSSLPPESKPIVTRHSANEMQRSLVGKASRILLVEDNNTNQQVAIGILKKLGLTADAASNGSEALKAMQSHHYDLVLMDVQMPVMDGLEATRHIRDKQSLVLDHDVPIIAMTALAFQEDRQRCLEAGMNDYVSKPIEPQTLAEVLADWLPDKTAQNEEKAAFKVIHIEKGPVPVFDKAALMRRLMEDENLAQIVIRGFVEDIPQQIQKLKDFLETGDLVGAERQAHTIKGASANISGDALQMLALDVENAGRSGDMAAMKARVPDLEAQFDRLKETL